MFSLIQRIFNILTTLLPVVLDVARDRRRRLLFGSPRALTEEEHRERARDIVARMAALGPTFIKLAQLLSSRADILPPLYVQELSSLQDHVPALPTARIEAVIEEELGRPAAEVFERFDAEPLASASLGQVHRARWGGEEVVVKVLKPGIRDQVDRDVRITMFFLRLLNQVMETHYLETMLTIVREFSVIVREEMDFHQEADHTRRLQEVLARHETLIIPKLFEELCTGRVLVSRYHKGTKINNAEGLRAAGVDTDDLVRRVFVVYFDMFLREGLFHADPHPGNIHVDADHNIILLDFGMVIQLPRDTQINLLRGSLGYVRRDLRTVVRSLYDLGLVDPEVNPYLIREAARTIIQVHQREDFSTLLLQDMINEIFDTFHKFPLHMPGDLAYFLKTLTQLEGLGLNFDTSFNGARVATPILRDMTRKLIPELRPQLRDILTEQVEDLVTLLGDLEHVMRRAAHEEFRVRIHPEDISRVENYLKTLTRYFVMGLFGMLMIGLAVLNHYTQGALWLTTGFLGVAFICLILVLILPTGRFTLFATKRLWWRGPGDER